MFHHVLGKYGKETAFKLWNDIIDHTNSQIFFETGILAEEGKYYWKDAILREIGSDELYYSELIRRMGPRLKRMDVVAELPIHNAVRLLHRFELHPLRSEHDLKASPEQIYNQGYIDDEQLEAISEFRRTEGAMNQRLVEAAETERVKFRIFSGTQFFHLLDNSSGRTRFGKRILDDPLKQIREYQIHAQVRHPRIIPCLGVSKRFGLLFERYPGVRSPEVVWQQMENRADVVTQIVSFFKEAEELRFQPGRLDIDPLSSAKSRALIDTVDLHANNFLITTSGNVVTDWKLVDLEYYSNTNRERNQRHRQAIMKMLHPQRKSWLDRLMSRLS
ncbi:MAG: hypothetical protein MPJ50_09990 [Pirellulales bacterium]|nr:hypothetical protein [Pirellulales bacterium]